MKAKTNPRSNFNCKNISEPMKIKSPSMAINVPIQNSFRGLLAKNKNSAIPIQIGAKLPMTVDCVGLDSLIDSFQIEISKAKRIPLPNTKGNAFLLGKRWFLVHKAIGIKHINAKNIL